MQSEIARNGLLYEEKEYKYQMTAEDPSKPREKKKKWKPESESSASQSSLPSYDIDSCSVESKTSNSPKIKKRKAWLTNATKNEIMAAKKKQNVEITRYNIDKAKNILKMIDQAQHI